jgi:uncharacterized coiled-coil protein SlyX
MKSNETARLLALCALFPLLQGCELLSFNTQSKAAEVVNVNEYELCVTPEQSETFTDFCSLDTWLVFVLEQTELTWPQRVEKIAELGEDSGSLLTKILLSQSTDTPYRNRLRAQNWVVKVSGESSSTMHKILNELVYQNSQQLLEFESAITILSRVNVRQQKTITELQTQLDAREQEIKKQQEQVDQLLKIETDLIEQNRSKER